MALEKISDYAVTAAAILDAGFLDISQDTGGGLESQKLPGSVLKSVIAAATKTIYNSNDSLAGNRQVDFDSNTLSFTGVGGFLSIGAISTGTFKLEIASNAAEDALRVNTNSSNNVLTVTDDGLTGKVGIGHAAATEGLHSVVAVRFDNKWTRNISSANALFNVHLANDSLDGMVYQVSSNSPVGSPFYQLLRTRGTIAAQLAVASGDTLGEYSVSAFNGTSPYQTATMRVTSTEAHSVGNGGSKLEWLTTANTTISHSVKMTLLGSGNLGILTAAPTEQLHVVGNGLFSQRLGVGASPLSNTGFFVTSISGDDFGAQIIATNLDTNGTGLQVTSTSATNNEGIFSISTTTGAGVESSGVEGVSIGTNGTNHYGIRGRARNGSSVSHALYGQIETGATVVSSSSTNAVHGLNQSTNGNKNRAGFFVSLASGKSIGIECSASGGTTNHAIITDGGNIGFGVPVPSISALLELKSTTQAFLITRMTAIQASAIAPVNGLMLYVNSTDATFTQVGFWGRVAGVWTALH